MTVVTTGHLMSGHTKSCGCLGRECRDQTTHGESHTRLNNIWYGMKARCLNPNSDAYSNYGGRGIDICDEWVHDYVSFRDWALSNGYADDLTLDRINVNLGYYPDNCRWATNKQQSNNKRNNVLLDYNGTKFTYSELADLAGISMNTLWMRINKLGWTVEKAVNTPVCI